MRLIFRPFYILLILVITLLISNFSVLAEEQVPEDTCILELTLPEGSTAKLGKGKHLPKKKFTYSGLKPDTTYYDNLEIRYPSGQTSLHKLFIKGGQLLRFAKLDPASKMPVQALQTGHAAPIIAAAFSRDSRYLATGDQVGHISVWDTKNLRQVRSLFPERIINKDVYEALEKDLGMVGEDFFASPVRNLYFSTDGHYLIALFAEMNSYVTHNLVVWDFYSGKELHRLKLGGSVSDATISPHGNQLVARILPGAREIMFLELAFLRGELSEQDAEKAAKKYEHLERRQLVAFDIESGKVIRQLDSQANQSIDSGKTIFNHDGSRIYAFVSDQLMPIDGIASPALAEGSALPKFWLGVWDGTTYKLLTQTRLPSFISAPQNLRFSPDGNALQFCAAEKAEETRNWLFGGSSHVPVMQTYSYDIKTQKVKVLPNETVKVNSGFELEHQTKDMQLFAKGGSGGTELLLKNNAGEEKGAWSFPVVFLKYQQITNDESIIGITLAISPDSKLVFLSGQAADTPQEKRMNRYLWELETNSFRPWLNDSLDPVNEMGISKDGWCCATTYIPSQGSQHRNLTIEGENIQYPNILWDFKLGQAKIIEEPPMSEEEATSNTVSDAAPLPAAPAPRNATDSLRSTPKETPAVLMPQAPPAATSPNYSPAPRAYPEPEAAPMPEAPPSAATKLWPKHNTSGTLTIQASLPEKEMSVFKTASFSQTSENAPELPSQIPGAEELSYGDFRIGSRFDSMTMDRDSEGTDIVFPYQGKEYLVGCGKYHPEGYPQGVYPLNPFYFLRISDGTSLNDGNEPTTLWKSEPNITNVAVGQESEDGRYVLVTGEINREIWYDVKTRQPLRQPLRDKSWNELRSERQINMHPELKAPEYPYEFGWFDVLGNKAIVRNKGTNEAAFTLKPRLYQQEFLSEGTAYWQASRKRWLLRLKAIKPFLGMVDLKEQRLLKFAIPANNTSSISGILGKSTAHLGAISPDGRLLAASMGDEKIYLWDIQTQRLVDTISLEFPATEIMFSLDSKQLVFGTGKEIWVWNLKPRGILRKMQSHGSVISSVAFGRNGKFILSASKEDGATRIWDFATGQELAKILTINRGKDWLVTTPEGLFDGSAEGRQKVFWRVGDGLNVVPVDRFFQDFYCPGLLAAIWKGERPLPKVKFGDKVPPTVRIISPKKGGAVEDGTVEIEVEVKDQGGGISGPWIRQNGMNIRVSHQTEGDNQNLQQKFNLTLIEGENVIEVQAASADGSWESEPARIVLNYQKPPEKSDLYLVSVGVSDYPGKKLDLKYARTDAEAMSKLFASRGLTLYGNIYQTNLKNLEATKEKILAAIQTVAGKASPRDTIVLFLAGHGAMVDGQYYFLPGDFKVRDSKWDEAVAQQALAAQEIGQALTAVPALKRLLVFDTGQSGMVAKETTSRNPFAFRGAIERLGRAQGGFTIASCSSAKEACEISDLQHGTLTYSLLAGMKAINNGPLGKQWIVPDAEDSMVRVLQWFGFADMHVPQLTQKFFGHAQPVQHSSTGVSFPVLPIPSGDIPSPSRLTETAKVEKLQPTMPARFNIGGAADKADLYLVAVGINEYRDKALNLKYARPDAEAIIKLFRERGPAIYENIHVLTLLDKQATKPGITEAFAQVAKKAGPEDTLILFVSGHGKMVGQRYYLITHEFEQGDGLIDTEVRLQCLPIDGIGDGLSKIKAKKRLLIFDTCASGGVLGMKQKVVDPFAFREAIDKLGTNQGTFIIAASAASETAEEHPVLKHGVLTYALLAGLDAVDSGPLKHRSVRMASTDGLIDVLQWSSFASGQGPRLMKQLYGREQFIQTSGKGISFPVLPLTSIPTGKE